MAKDIQDYLMNEVILVVDDDEDSLEVAETLLTFCGATVITADGGQEGYEKAIEQQPQFIISDLSMPDVNGWQMLKLLKDDDRTKHIPVVALTAHALVGDREKAIEAGFENYLTKPINPLTFSQNMLRIIAETPSIAALFE